MKYLLLLGALGAVSCGSDSTPVAPTPVVPACESQNTAEVIMANASPNNYTYTVAVDNINRGTLSPGASLPALTLTAGINHTLVSTVTNTGVIACSSTTSFAKCATQTLTCRF